MKVLGIDPGTATTGWGVIEKIKNSELRIQDCGCIETNKKLPQPERLSQIVKEIQKIIKAHKPDIAAIERLFFFKNLKTAMAVSESRGAILATVAASKIPVYEYTPLEIKQALIGYGRAEKRQIQRMVKILLNLKDVPKPDDLADALACAICCANSLKMNRLKFEIRSTKSETNLKL